MAKSSKKSKKSLGNILKMHILSNFSLDKRGILCLVLEHNGLIIKFRKPEF